MAKKGKGKKRDVSREEMRKRAKQEAVESQSGGGGTVNVPKGVEGFVEVKSGKLTFSLLPFAVSTKRTARLTRMPEGSQFYRIPFKQHRQVGPENLRRVCRSTIGAACPICEEFNAVKATAENEDEYKGLRYSKRSLYLVEHRDDLKILDISDHAFGKLLLIELDELDEDAPWVTDEDVKIVARFEDESAGTGTYPKAVKISIGSRDEAVDDEVMDAALAIDLGECLEVLSYDALKAEFYGMDPDEEDDDGDGDDEPPEEDGDEDDYEKDEDEKDEDDKLSKLDEQIDAVEEEAEELEVDIPAKLLRKARKGDEDALEEIEELVADAKKAAKKGKGKKKEEKEDDGGGDDECPNKHVFGKDFDEHDDCDDCEDDHADTYKACKKAKKK